jgi:hypothetical protein
MRNKCVSVAAYCGVLFLTPSLALAQTFLCVAERSAGFSFNDKSKKWEYARFDVEGRKYIVKQVGARWTWAEFGREFPADCGAFPPSGIIKCQDTLKDVIFNSKTLRYQMFYAHGYAIPSSGVEGSDTPYIEIGVCSKF